MNTACALAVAIGRRQSAAFLDAILFHFDPGQVGFIVEHVLLLLV